MSSGGGAAGGARRRDAVAIVLLLAVSVPCLTLRLETCPAPWFDEGLRTNLARTVLEHGVYGTASSDGIHAFDPATSTGPADIAAVAASFRLFGIGTAQARGAIVLFGLVAILSLYAIARWLWGRPAALVAVLTALAVPRLQSTNLIAMARQVMGEAPAAALSLVSLLLLFRSWGSSRRWPLFAAGCAAMLAFQSKGQMAIVSLFPTILVAAWARSRKVGVDWRRVAAFAAGSAMIASGWLLVQLASTTPEQRLEHAEILRDQVLSQFLIVGRRYFMIGTWPTFALMAVAVGLGVLALTRDWRPLRLASTRRSAELALLTGMAVTALWYIGLTPGWTRYAFLALVFAGLLIGRALYLLWLRARRWLRRWPGLRPLADRTALAVLALFGLVINLPLLRSACPTEPFAAQMADRIRTSVPRDAVIESNDWEIDALSGHWLYHHPTQRQTTAAIRSFTALEDLRYDYDLFAADPDYLLIGPFGDAFRIYSQAEVRQSFELVGVDGPYRLYRRLRPATEESSAAGERSAAAVDSGGRRTTSR